MVRLVSEVDRRQRVVLGGARRPSAPMGGVTLPELSYGGAIVGALQKAIAAQSELIPARSHPHIHANLWTHPRALCSLCDSERDNQNLIKVRCQQ